MLDLRQLRYFVTVAETLHFGKAAARLHMSQPPLSRHIALLEKELDVKLFERTSRSVVLTAAGSQLLRDSLHLMASLEEIPGRAQAASKGLIGEVKIGFTMYAANSILPGLARRFREEFPAVELKLLEKLPQEIVADLQENKLDVGISIEGETGSRLKFQEVWHESLCAALPSNHPCATSNDIHLEELKNDSFILVSRETTHVLHDSVLQACRAAGFEPTVIMETRLQQTIVSLVAEGLAVALVPDSMRRVSIDGLVYRPLQNAPQITQVIVWNRENRNPSAKALIGMAQTPGKIN